MSRKGDARHAFSVDLIRGLTYTRCQLYLWIQRGRLLGLVFVLFEEQEEQQQEEQQQEEQQQVNGQQQVHVRIVYMVKVSSK